MDLPVFVYVEFCPISRYMLIAVVTVVMRPDLHSGDGAYCAVMLSVRLRSAQLSP